MDPKRVLPAPAWLHDNTDMIFTAVIAIWLLMTIIQLFLALGTAYRCTKKGNDNGFGLFIYLLGFGLAAFIPGLGLHYYIKHLPPKIQVVNQIMQPQVVRIVNQSQMPPQQVYTQSDMNNNPQVQPQASPQSPPGYTPSNSNQANYTPEQIAYMQQRQAEAEKAASIVRGEGDTSKPNSPT